MLLRGRIYRGSMTNLKHKRFKFRIRTDNRLETNNKPNQCKYVRILLYRLFNESLYHCKSLISSALSQQNALNSIYIQLLICLWLDTEPSR